MAKRLFDIVFSLALLLALLPVLVLVAIGVLVSDTGPVMYHAKRVGLNGREFVMHKFRTMRIRSEVGSAISSDDDPRIFRFGKIMRRLKLDELPQLWDVLRGEMSIVGPRPEDPGIVAEHYTREYRKTLRVKPGLTSPGSIYYYLHAEHLLMHGQAEQDYVARVLPAKMKLDIEYAGSAGIITDIGIVFRTATAILSQAFGGRTRKIE